MRVQTPQNPVANFVQKTFEILNNNQYAKIIHWNANGKEFTIKDIQQFQITILPKFFRHRNINSFIRQLNMYGFHKSRKEPSKNIFSHPNFVKDRMDLLQKVKRKIKLDEISNQKIQENIDEPEMKAEMFTPMKSEIVLASVTSLPNKSSIYIQRESDPLKNLLSKSFINDLNPQICLKMRQNYLHANEEQQDDNISIANDIVRQRQALQNRTQGISIVKTLNFMEDFGL